jgi:hypothetical protein
MVRKRASEIFAAVDPHLKVIDAGTRHGRRGKKAKKLTEVAGPAPEPYKPLPLTKEQWEAARGIICPICGEETYQLFPYGFTGTRKACKKCIEKRAAILQRRAIAFKDKEAFERRRKILEARAATFARRRR